MKKTTATLGILIAGMFFVNENALAQANFENCSATDCHITQTKFSMVHDPVGDDCLTCHETEAKNHPVKNKKEFTLVSPVPELCSDCHDEKTGMGNVHAPVEDGDCLSCHNPHSSDNEALLRAEGGEVCADCHDITDTENPMHGPVAANMCTACHNPHQSEISGLMQREGLDLCLFCHTNKKDVQSKHSVHEPFLDGCLDCHSPHHSPYKYMVIKDVPGLCFDCHEAVQVSVGQTSEVHGPFQAGGKCYKCHDAHVSDYDNLLMDKEQNLCFTCHDKTLKKGNLTVKNIKKRVDESKYVHGPIVDDGCSPCHEAHTPDNFFLLSAAFPKGSYGEGKAESFAHCFDCHDSELMEVKNTTNATEFREGNVNLHYVHVNREKARNCTTCHDVHGSKYPFIIASKVQFGKWEMPMKFKATPNGGSCLTGCHKLLAYDRTATASK